MKNFADLEHSIYDCPACGRPLKVTSPEVPGWTLYCAYGPCPSAACNEGAWGPTEQLAAQRLDAAYDLEKLHTLKQLNTD